MRRLVIPLLFGVLGTAVLLALGAWQVQRLQWKQGILEQIESRMTAAPQLLPETPSEARDEYMTVRVSGRFTADHVDVLISRQGQGAGFRVITAFQTDGGRRILVDRGFLPEARKTDPRPEVDAKVLGTLLWPDEVDSFTPEPDFGRNMWFARDLPAIAAALGTEPVLVVARETSEEAPIASPMPVDSVGIVNNHLEYAITWFGLAAIWAAMTGYFLWRQRRGANKRI